MTILFQDNFDGESEGTSPPANWLEDSVLVPGNCEVDDVQAHSAPHSMWLKGGAASGACRHEEASGFTSAPIIVWLYFDTNNQMRRMTAQATTGDNTGTEQLILISFTVDGDIMYYDGEWQDTGYNYTTGWHKVEIVLDVDNDQFDMWYDTVKIVADGGFRNSKSIAKAIHFTFTADTDLWVDDVQIGEAGWTGNVAGVENPAKVSNIAVEDIASVQGVT